VEVLLVDVDHLDVSFLLVVLLMRLMRLRAPALFLAMLIAGAVVVGVVVDMHWTHLFRDLGLLSKEVLRGLGLLDAHSRGDVAVISHHVLAFRQEIV
jgi:hypothetical protein